MKVFQRLIHIHVFPYFGSQKESKQPYFGYISMYYANTTNTPNNNKKAALVYNVHVMYRLEFKNIFKAKN